MDPTTFGNGITLTSDNTNFNFNNLNFETNTSKTVVYIYSPNGIPAYDSIRVEINNSVKDSLGKNFDGNLDGDPSGSSDDKTISVGTFLLGDFDTDENMDAADIDQFSTGWYGDDPNFEVGPTSGEAPYLIAVPDGEYDIDDLMSFIMSWNWAKQNGMLARTIAGDYQDNNLQYTWDGHAIRIGLNQLSDIHTVHLQIPEHDKISIIDNARLNEELLEIENTLFFADTSMGEMDFVISTIKPMDPGENDWIISIPVKIAGREVVRTDLYYEYFIDGVQYSGKSELELKPIPQSYHLAQNYPNPFNPVTVIQYDIPEDGHVELVIYDILGRQVKTLVNTSVKAGYKSIKWDGKNDYGITVTSGMYFFMIRAANFSKTRK
jgi:hypothetical protein